MTSYAIGELAEKYEVGNRGVGYISDGDRWDPGGDSYGSYQLATKVGTLQGYLRTNLPYVVELNKYTIKSDAFNKAWKDIAKRDPKGFKQSQFDYVSTISYKPCREYASAMGINNNLALNSALFSISNQHGGYRKLISMGGDYKGKTTEEQINMLYDARARYINSLATLSPQLKKSLVHNRCVLERRDCLKLIDVKEGDTPDITGRDDSQNWIDIILDYFGYERKK